MAEQKKKFLNNETKIGIIVVIAIAVLYFGINFLKGINIFTPNTTLYVQYDRVDGIVKTSHVLINGYQVGHVSDIVFDYTKEAPITLELTVDRK
ncbi:MAG: MCE family protein, partial [Paludibacteraceae bacterium]|nr:MCE family protein [Paludibacteraceae bacterium]